jgi:hypothetical protein
MGGTKISILLTTKLNIRTRKSFFSYFDAAIGCCHMVRHFNFNISMPLMPSSNISMEGFSFWIGKTEREK